MLSKRRTFYVFVGFIVLQATFYTYFHLNMSDRYQRHIYRQYGSLDDVKISNKLVLLWSSGWKTEEGVEIINNWNVSIPKDCPYKCDFTAGKDLLEESHPVIFHQLYTGPPIILPRRNGMYDQIWMFLSMESPMTLLPDLTPFMNQFNWTATYRLDSDVHYPYGEFVFTQTGNYDLPTEESVMNKSLVAWMHSNCLPDSQRGVLVDRLKKFIPVTIYGRCSKRGRLNGTRSQMYKELSKSYKFWLSFENSLCADYVTEKLYYPLVLGMVPILYADKSVLRLIPPGSYINIRDFKTMEALAQYLKFLDQNPEEYLKYFEWRKHLRAREYPDDEFWCKFCTKLSSNNYYRHYRSIHDWFYKNYTKTNLCSPPDAQIMSLKN